MNWKELFKNFSHIFSGRGVFGGLEISDIALRFARLEGKNWQLLMQRLPPGIIEGGRVKKYPEFLEALKGFRREILRGRNTSRKINAIVSLSSATIYSQIFSLPAIADTEGLERAVELNLQMVSPGDLAQSYSSWQVAGKDKNLLNIEVLSAFINRGMADEMLRALEEAGFLAVVMEFRALSLTRMFREAASGFDVGKSYFVLNLDSNGLDSLVVKNGQPYFEYFNFWKDIFQSEDREIPLSVFETAVIRNLNQVLNFYTQHWPDDRIAEVLISAGDLNAEANRIIKENFSLSTRELALKLTQPVSAEWFVVLGSGMRSLVRRQQDTEINFLGTESQEAFRRHHLANFIDLWRVLLPVGIGVVLAAFFLANIFLGRVERSLELAPAFGIGEEQARTLEELQNRVLIFNRSIALIRAVRESNFSKASFLNKVNTLAGTHRITIVRVNFNGFEAPIQLRGEARSVDDIRGFRNAFDADSAFAQVDLPLSEIAEIKSGTQQAFSFSLSFSFNPLNTN